MTEGWVIMNANMDQYRAWQNGGTVWVKDLADATFYARRVDAEAVHLDDEAAWRVVLKPLPDGGEAVHTGQLRAASKDSLSAPTGEVGGVPEGWVLVPREITLAMQHAYFGVIDKNMRRVETDAAFGRYASQKEAYRAMIAAAPSSREA